MKRWIRSVARRFTGHYWRAIPSDRYPGGWCIVYVRTGEKFCTNAYFTHGAMTSIARDWNREDFKHKVPTDE